MRSSLFACVAALAIAGPAAAQPLAPGAAPATGARNHNGRSGALDVEPPRIDQAIEVDGQLTEGAWSEAAVLNGFSRYAPVDGAPADHATDVLVWYSTDRHLFRHSGGGSYS